MSEGTVSEANARHTVWICRHGNRIDFVDPSWKGNDPHLSPDGVIQAKETGVRLRGEGIQHIFASPFLRTLETAHHIAEALDLPVKIEHGACEWMNPEWFPEPPVYIPVEIEDVYLEYRFRAVEGWSATDACHGIMRPTLQSANANGKYPHDRTLTAPQVHVCCWKTERSAHFLAPDDLA